MSFGAQTMVYKASHVGCCASCSNAPPRRFASEALHEDGTCRMVVMFAAITSAIVGLNDGLGRSKDVPPISAMSGGGLESGGLEAGATLSLGLVTWPRDLFLQKEHSSVLRCKCQHGVHTARPRLSSTLDRKSVV